MFPNADSVKRYISLFCITKDFPTIYSFRFFYVSAESKNITIMSLVLSYPHKSSQNFVDFQSIPPISIAYIRSDLIMQIYFKSLVTKARRKPLLRIFSALYTCYFVNANTPRRWVVFPTFHETGIRAHESLYVGKTDSSELE